LQAQCMQDRKSGSTEAEDGGKAAAAGKD